MDTPKFDFSLWHKAQTLITGRNHKLAEKMTLYKNEFSLGECMGWTLERASRVAEYERDLRVFANNCLATGMRAFKMGS